MTHTVFISHAGADSTPARAVAARLEQTRIQTILDRDELKSGDDFLRFMEDGLSRSDYCLLLWSEAAAGSPWVGVEWRAAFHRTITESRRFLIVGRLEEYAPPSLLAPRLRIDLFPDLDRGLDELLDMLRDDETAAAVSGRPVGLAAQPVAADGGGETVYVTSELFSLTMPLKLDFSSPSGLHLDRIRTDLELPSRFDYRGRMGMSIEYRLLHQGRVLSRDGSLRQQGVAPKGVIVLEVEISPYAATSPQSGQLSAGVFRSGGQARSGNETNQREKARREALAAVRSAVGRAGLGP